MGHDIQSFIKKYCYPTGSYHWGVHTDESDMDFLVLKDDLNPTSLLLLRKYPLTYDEEYDGLTGVYSYRYTQPKGRVINFVSFLDKGIMGEWKRATTIMETMPLGLIKNKEGRIIIFEALIKAIRCKKHNKNRNASSPFNEDIPF